MGKATIRRWISATLRITDWLQGEVLVFRQENFDGSKTRKIQPCSTTWILATRQLLID
ncbi:hypothetical protein [Leptothermofonsia sp. ETS-13]|uniref:hypothetical protein n=1 Tax=Leptothermofonsia sp. ETS-13 TaxID=3035696 RepID=UPI003BA19D74